ncbi:hypothetical protein SDC9_194894 [bioreactor metagenome]|uniref:Uncharacterized protein n=1 Tax=bioreactor metagenome TaxID=1076179 RepID=A0A645I910_9ZZZZ
MAGRKSVDAFFVVEHINLGDRHAGGDGHLLDHVTQLALIGMGRVGIEEPSAERFGDGTAALGQGGGFVETANDDDAERAEHDVKEKLGIPQDEFGRWGARLLLFGVDAVENQQTGEINRSDDAHDGDHEVNHQHLRVLPGFVLMLKKIHELSLFKRTKPSSALVAPAFRWRTARRR